MLINAIAGVIMAVFCYYNYYIRYNHHHLTRNSFIMKNTRNAKIRSAVSRLTFLYPTQQNIIGP